MGLMVAQVTRRQRVLTYDRRSQAVELFLESGDTPQRLLPAQRRQPRPSGGEEPSR